MAIVEFKGVSRIYKSGDHELKALDNVDMRLEEGKFVVILGPSGAGKSTLLNLLGGLDSPTSGTILVDGKDISTLTNDELADYRASKVGFVFQFYNLIPTLTVLENVSLVRDIAKDALEPKKMLEEVELGDHIHHFPSELSGGEQQRVLYRPGFGEKSENPALRRADWCARFGNRRACFEAAFIDGAQLRQNDCHCHA